MSHDAPRCSYPVGEASDPCGKPAVCVFLVGRESYWRCRIHDTKAARALADEKGIERREVMA